ncbi:hypothetical protein [Methylobacterium brachythecii]|uniref:Uncharacterized protein n=1 Tax=Methylobacterium brachythecii TaxID=1176177 RepID=A0A7W6APZ4_9HYPH|nr:hypothetical protein [Methylobacterium brachythecii]MBB3905115.1 hypothetical protein [Methylobacterium brachythecii]GLS44377.1 hypothetical protein GCM10007884_23650 [Methylobacterium brachythecii]
MLRIALPFLIVPFAVMGGGIATGRAAEPRLAVALACSGSIAGSDCSRETALDIVVAPAGETDCPKVAQVLATHLDLPAGGYHKLICERRKS